MTRTKTILTISMLLTGVFALGLSNASVFAASNIVTNGSFEDSWWFTCTAPSDVLPTNYFGIEDWLVTGHSIDWICGYWPASDGEHSLDLAGGSHGGIKQELTTTVGTVYQVDFDMAANTDGPPAVKTMQVSAADSTETYTSTNNVFLGEWEQQTFYFVATDTKTTLEFKSIDPTGKNSRYGPTLDNVSATEAPQKLDVCHKEKKTINISINAVFAHLAHGDIIGVC